jgi:hypothetical protein
MDELSYLSALEEVLAEHPAFGDSDYIHEHADLCYRRRLGDLAARLHAADVLSAAMSGSDLFRQRRVLRHPAVRFAINTALRQLAIGAKPDLSVAECEEIFRAAAHYLDKGVGPQPAEFGVGGAAHLTSGPFLGDVWSGEHGDVLGRSFPRLVELRFAHKTVSGAELSIPDTAALDSLARGASLLEELLPLLSRGALSHVSLIATFPLAPWKGAASMSQFGMSGVVFLCSDLLQSPWWVAEHLFHEALHQKLYDFRHGHSLLEPDFARADAPRVRSLWNVPGEGEANAWDAHRAVAAFHVYVHLALLSAVAEERAADLEPTYGPLQPVARMTTSRKAMERAHYLAEEIRSRCFDELGLGGKRLVEWLTAVLNALDYSPPPLGAHIHLLLDRYRGEARAAQNKLVPTGSFGIASAGPLSPEPIRELAALAEREVADIRAMLRAMNAGAALGGFDQALRLYAEGELGTRFAELRGLIVRTLLSLSSDGYSLPSGVGGGDEKITELVETSSRQLHRIFEAQRG